MSESNYNAQTVIDAAEAKLQSEGVPAAQTAFQSALLDWVDDVTMGDMGGDMERVRGEIAKLWLAYAQLNRKANLNKSATEVYEQATNCPVAGGMGKIWTEYTQFLEERGRPRTAQKLYLRALVGGGEEGNNEPRVKDPADQAELWEGFLRMMQSLRKNPELTLEDLKKAVEKEHLGQTAAAGNDGAVDEGAGTSENIVPDQQASTAVAAEPQKDEEDMPQPPAKRSRWDQKTPVETLKVNASSIDTAAGVLTATSKTMPPDIETLWHARDGGSLPSRPEPPLFAASPPKLGDPTGKDLVGNDAALRILKMLTAKTHDGKCLGTTLLELCHACWMMTALKEEEVVKAQEMLEKKLIAYRRAMEAELDARASVAGGALAAVQQANESERNSFHAQIEAQRQQLLSSSAWEFRKLLYTQQIILTSAKLPGFDGPSVDSATIAFQSKVCSVMHSAFYLRARVGEASHVTMLNKQLENLEKYISTAVKEESPEQPQFQAPPPFPVPPQPPQFQQPMMPQYTQQPFMYVGQPQQMMGAMGYQTMPMQMMPQQQGQQTLQPPQYMNPFQPGQQQNNLP